MLNNTDLPEKGKGKSCEAAGVDSGSVTQRVGAGGNAGSDWPPEAVEAAEASGIAAALPRDVSKDALLLFCRGERVARRVIEGFDGSNAPYSGLDPQKIGALEVCERREVIFAAVTAALSRVSKTTIRVPFAGELVWFIGVYSNNRFGRCSESSARMMQACGMSPSSDADLRSFERTMTNLVRAGIINRERNPNPKMPWFAWLAYDVSLLTETPFSIFEALAPSPRERADPSSSDGSNTIDPSSSDGSKPPDPSSSDGSNYVHGGLTRHPVTGNTKKEEIEKERSREVERATVWPTADDVDRYHNLAVVWGLKADAIVLRPPTREDSMRDLAGFLVKSEADLSAMRLALGIAEDKHRKGEASRGGALISYLTTVFLSKKADLTTPPEARAKPTQKRERAPSPSKSTISDDIWRHYVQFWLDGKGWPTASSTAPDCPHCKVPAGVLAEFRAQIDDKIAGGQR